MGQMTANASLVGLPRIHLLAGSATGIGVGHMSQVQCNGRTQTSRLGGTRISVARVICALLF